MGQWLVGTECLARCRFALSPLVETVAAVGVLAEIRPEPWRRGWLAAHQPAFRAHLATTPDPARWLTARHPADWPAELRLPVPDPDADPRLLDLTAADLPPALAELLDWTWQHVVRPEWPARLRALRTDLTTRRERAERHGWPAALPQLGPQHRWLPDGRLRLTAPELPPSPHPAPELLFVPTSARHGWLCPDESRARIAVVYPTSAAPVPGLGRRTPPASLGRLLGSARAALLTGLDHPRDTTQLAALTGLGPAAVDDHLAVLLDARLVAGTTTPGRYYRTALAEALLSAQPG
ncbi:ArsR family transcriptional regulator [Kitasatospora sp. NA04385]|uniref:ArsR family transcriptional regulator n=1 Tax=Kitasatospora sp. NA04385 TaxID=2742135 RepID=UPI0015905976|nr:ArsR family transcriptional regulator [Kitasatospora sp. NA04385]QKW21831.1 ArsR family transcriptional regulator [Kitasatospora sp. NA04385]